MKFEEKHEGSGSPTGKSQPYLGERHQGNRKPAANGKTEASLKQEANVQCNMPERSLNTYSWQEIQRHNQEADQWLVINCKADRHPDGREVLSHYAREDAADVFRAMHPKLDIAQLYLKPLLIRELPPGEPSQEGNKNSKLLEDFQELRRKLEAMNMFNANLGFFLLLFAQILILEALAWLMLWHFGNGWPITILISFLLTISQDLPRNWWNYGHFQHHAKMNIYPKDPDIYMGPILLVGDLQPVKYGKKKIKYINYEKQHLYFYMGESPWSHVPCHPISLRQSCQARIVFPFFMPDIAWVSSFYIGYFITFGRFYRIFGTILLIYLVKSLESPWMALVIQMSHIPMKMSREENRDWLSTQVLATCNVEQSTFNNWFTGHVNFQVEHHLFPTMPHHNYHKVAPLARSLCAKNVLQYVEKPMLKAFGDIGRALKRSAALWMDAYYETWKQDENIRLNMCEIASLKGIGECEREQGPCGRRVLDDLKEAIGAEADGTGARVVQGGARKDNTLNCSPVLGSQPGTSKLRKQELVVWENWALKW
ncbi:hypothetical protein HPG69_010266 [Diceros bicornis minor]|uniref:Fatty acid desaturase domain-containing protein n=1 Tax=Diceros bicornis minor TaxID=77932 RepID=A0A7J7EFB3_DICBM|nr:hypothetical protein HPG69_010266 [Diceros bicornis minor]